MQTRTAATMGEVIVAAVFIVLSIIALAVGVPYVLSTTRQRQALQRAPEPAVLGSGDPAAQSRTLVYYRLLQKTCRHLELVLQEDELVPHLRVEERKEIQKTLKQFYDL